MFGKALSLIPDESGMYLAVHFDKGLTVLQLTYGRGEQGEFSGGKKQEVLCRYRFHPPFVSYSLL